MKKLSMLILSTLLLSQSSIASEKAIEGERPNEMTNEKTFSVEEIPPAIPATFPPPPDRIINEKIGEKPFIHSKRAAGKKPFFHHSHHKMPRFGDRKNWKHWVEKELIDSKCLKLNLRDSDLAVKNSDTYSAFDYCRNLIVLLSLELEKEKKHIELEQEKIEVFKKMIYQK